MNIHSDRLWQFLLDIARRGQILALLLGPPCETWSGARLVESFDEDGKRLAGPRPVRGDLDAGACMA